MHRVVQTCARTIQRDGLVGYHASGPVGGRRINPMSVQIGLSPCDEEGARLVQHMQAGKVDIAAVHHVDRAGFGDQHIKRMNIVQLAIRDMDKAWNVAPQIEQRVHLHGGLR
jgi:hypothetical protein